MLCRRREKIPTFKCQIVVNEKSNQFYPGDRVQGQVIYSNQNDMMTKGFIVSLAGQTHVNIKEGTKSEQFLYEFKIIFGNTPRDTGSKSERYIHTCTSTKKMIKAGVHKFPFYFGLGKKYKRFLIIQLDQRIKQSKSYIHSCKKKMLKGGVHKFPFYFDFGKKDLPMSFSSENGSIRYQIVVHFLGEYRCVSKAEKTIQLNVPTINLLNDPSLSKPLIYKAGRQNLKILFKLERKLLLPKQDLSFTLEIYNVSNAKATISLIQKLNFKATLETKTIKRKIWSISNDYFEVYWTDYFKTPEAETVPPTNFGCDKSMTIIDVNYFIKLEVESNEPDKSMKAEIPIKIGFPDRQNLSTSTNTNRVSNEPNTSRNCNPPVIFEPPRPIEEVSVGPTPSTSFNSQGFLSRNINPAVLAPAYSELSLYSIAETLPPPYEDLSTTLEDYHFRNCLTSNMRRLGHNSTY